MSVAEENNPTEVLCIKNVVKVMKESENDAPELAIKVYKRRWIVLGLFILYSGASACQWIQYSIVTNIVTRYYGVSSVAVDWTAMSFMAYYVILVFPATYAVDRCGLRWTAILGSGVSCLGSWVKVFSVGPDKFYITFIGQSLVGFTQSINVTVKDRNWRMSTFTGECQHIPNTYVGERSNISLHSCTFGPSPVYVDNHRYALVKVQKRGTDKEATSSLPPNPLFCWESVSFVSWILVLTLPGRLAAQWFPARQLSTATSLGIFGGQLGIALSFLFTPMIVKNRENLHDIGEDLSYLFWGVAIITTVAFLLVLILFENDPKLPPSKTRALQKVNRTQEEEKFMEPIKRLFKNKSFLLLCNTYGLNIGVLNTFGTLLNQMFLLHFENGEEDAGRIGLAIIVTGMLGSVSFGIILDKTHKFKETTVIVYFLSLCGQILFAVFTCLEIKWMVYLSAIFLGFFMSGYLALGYEMSAEYTYPESESVAGGFLNVANNLYGVILVIIMGKLLESYGDIPVHIGLCAALLIGFIMTVFTKDEQRRQAARKTAQYEEINQADKNEKKGLSNN